MTEACQSIVDNFKPENLAYINEANKMSIDCHCDPNPHPPELADKISIDCDCDPVAIDLCCYDVTRKSNGRKTCHSVKL